MAQEDDDIPSPKKRDRSSKRDFDFSADEPDNTEPEDRPKKKRKEHVKEAKIGESSTEVKKAAIPPIQWIILDFVLFRRMITPIIIQFLFWATAVLLICSGIYQIFDGLIPQSRPVYTTSGFMGETRITYTADKKSDIREVFMGFLTMTIGPMIVRIYCELLILFFRMNETLTDIRSNTAPK